MNPNRNKILLAALRTMLNGEHGSYVELTTDERIMARILLAEFENIVGREES